MKQFKVLISASLLLITSLSLAESGVGVSATSDSSTIYFPINMSDTLRIEPIFTFSYSEYESKEVDLVNGNTVDSTDKTIGFGLGLFHRSKKLESIDIYSGVRVLRIIREEFYQENNNTEYSDKLAGYFIAPTVGVEYYVTDNFSLSGEVDWYYSSLAGREGSRFGDDEKVTTSSTGTRTHLVARFMF